MSVKQSKINVVESCYFCFPMSLHLGFIWPSFPNQWNSSGTRNPKASFSSLSCREQGFQDQGCSKTFMGAFSAFLFSVTPSSTENDKNYSLWLLSYKWSESCSVVSDFVTTIDCTVHGVLQARILQWVAIPFSRGSSQPRDRTQVSHIAGGLFTSWAIREAVREAFV